jgi:hypothetical protein
VVPKVPVWVLLLVGAAVFVGCGIFLALQDLGTANADAGIASFFLALVTGIGSLLSLARSKQEQEKKEQEKEVPAGGKGSQPPRSRSVMFARGNGVVSHGDNVTINAVIGRSFPGNEEPEGRTPGRQ